LPQHDPMMDARQSARLMIEALNTIGTIEGFQQEVLRFLRLIAVYRA
jgi:hypothetical protein